MSSIPVVENVPESQFGKRKSVFDGKRIRAIKLYDPQSVLALLQYLCNAAHERAMGRDTEIAPLFEWMERFLTIAASKGFPEMPESLYDARMWGMLSSKDAEAFSRYGLINVVTGYPNTVLRHIRITSLPAGASGHQWSPPGTYNTAFADNPDPNFKWRVLTRAHGNVWVLKYPARYMAIQWMMAYVSDGLEHVSKQLDEDSMLVSSSSMIRPRVAAAFHRHIDLVREAYSMVEACYAEWVEFLRNSGLLGKYYSPEIEGIIEAPQERRPPPLLEH